MIENEFEFKKLVAENIIKYRKANNLTQLQLAEKLNYSDKAVSKWERGESLPDLYILSKIAKLFGITLNDLVVHHKEVKERKSKFNRKVISLLSAGLTWLLAFIVYVILTMVNVSYAWLSFIYAIPASLIVLIVFSKLWGNRIYTLLFTSGLYYTIPLAIGLTLDWKYNSAYLFFLAIPLQILSILFFFRKNRN